MKSYAIGVILAICVSHDAGSQSKLGQSPPLEGAWEVVTNQSQTGTQDEAANRNIGYTLTITSRKFIWKTRGDVDEVEYVIDPTTKPANLDLDIRDGKANNKCIYQLEGDTLRLCIAHFGEMRPTTFTVGKGISLVILKRKKP